MIDYLNQTDRQMMGDALRGNPSGTVASGGTQAGGGGTDMQTARQQNMDMWNQRQQQLSSQGQDMSGMAKTAGKALGQYFGGGGGADWLSAGSADAGTGSILQTGGGYGNSGMAYPEMFGGSSAGAGGAGMGTLAATGAALLGAGIGADNLLNKNDDKWYSANKINDYGTVGIGGKDVGFRFGDLANGINPVTWAKDPQKGATGLLNFFTGGVFD